MKQVRVGRFVWAAVMVMVLAACGKPAELPYQRDTSLQSLGEAGDKALKTFAEQCSPVAKGAADLEYIKVSSGSAYPKTPDFGWNKGMTIELKVKPGASSSDAIRTANGHVCTFDLGGGFQPGIHTTKSSCAALCGGPADSNFIPVAALSVLESQQDAEAAEQKRQAEGAEQFAALEKKAKSGDYQAQRNYAYSFATGAQGAPYNPVKACAWYAVILNSGNPKVNDGDKSNVQLYCGRLDEAGRQAAIEMATAITAQIR